MTALVVLPGLDGTATLHSAFCAAANFTFDTIKVVPYPPDHPLGYAELETLARAELPSTPFVLLGESFSGPIALSVATDPPPGLIGIVLSTTFARPAIPALSPFAPLVRFMPARAAPIALLSWWLLGQWTTPALRSSLKNALDSAASSVLAFRAAAALRPPAVNLAAISAPTLYLRATGDRLLAASAGEHIRSSIPQSRLVDIAGPHLLLQAAPGPCAHAIGDFVQDIHDG
ncbi:alpha/beta fold hydrolase [Marilutibacter alkalisoli]|uniref:Lysophospholipase n=1 Tax=Marilutibacter alkalisoli TaxID=2591633 RepID=A0A514BN74_9GAMM|nr:alpha/beta hydrolase [Lysobacter alkalisoli]QDH68785.1 lysophospholipase [Lysobacter alkalisoli]